MTVPVFVDNAEAATWLTPMACQIIRLVVSAEDKKLRVETGGEVETKKETKKKATAAKAKAEDTPASTPAKAEDQINLDDLFNMEDFG
jgi:membrane protein involved in colicin uptake